MRGLEEDFAGGGPLYSTLYYMTGEVLTWAGRSVEHANCPGCCSERHDVLLHRIIG